MEQETAEDIKRHFDVVAQGLREEIGDLRSEVGGIHAGIGDLRSEIDGLHAGIGDLRSEVGGLHAGIGDLRSEIGGLHAGIGDAKRHFNVVAESLRSDIRTVAEGFVATNERLDRFEVRMSEKFREMEALFRLSFTELDRRIQSL
jgi:archaellum component FlaC